MLNAADIKSMILIIGDWCWSINNMFLAMIAHCCFDLGWVLGGQGINDLACTRACSCGRCWLQRFIQRFNGHLRKVRGNKFTAMLGRISMAQPDHII